MDPQNRPKQTLDNLDNVDDELELELEDNFDDSQVFKPYDPTQIRVDPKSFSLRNILDMIDDGDLDLAPDFQRMRVWSPKQKSRLIESVLLRIPLPAFYFSSDSEGYMQVVDGVQRLSTIHDFVRRNTFPLQHLEYLDRELGGKSFSDIKGSIWAKRIDSTQITVNVIDPQTPTRVKFDIFKRINTGGTPLNAQEIRHCMSGKKIRELLKRLTALKSFDQATGGSLSGHVRMADRELALRWVSFTLLEDLNTYGSAHIANLEDLLNTTNELVDSDLPINIDDLIENFDRAMINTYELFGKHAFRKWMVDSNKSYPLNKALFEAWSVPLAKVEKSQIVPQKKEIQDAFRELCSFDLFFMNSISSGTGDPAKVRYRFNKVNEILQARLQ
jgi:hypothetical protein